MVVVVLCVIWCVVEVFVSVQREPVLGVEREIVECRRDRERRAARSYMR